MTKQQAIAEVISAGKKVRHKSFMDHEYIHMVDGKMVCEDGCQAGDFFWSLRRSSAWDEGWSIYEENK